MIFDLFRKDEKAAAATEFALIMPFMLVLWVGLVDVSNILSANRKVVSAAKSAADLVARETSVTDEKLNDVVSAVKMIFAPLPTSKLSINISSVVFDPSTGAPELDWETSETTIVMEGDSILTDVEGLGQAGDSVIVVSVTYEHDYLFPQFWTGLSVSFFERAYAKPRRSSKITHI
jgi:Flp pilus assembly protein TadG